MKVPHSYSITTDLHPKFSISCEGDIKEALEKAYETLKENEFFNENAKILEIKLTTLGIE